MNFVECTTKGLLHSPSKRIKSSALMAQNYSPDNAVISGRAAGFRGAPCNRELRPGQRGRAFAAAGPGAEAIGISAFSLISSVGFLIVGAVGPIALIV
jgi:hypothetical protein